MRPTWASVSSMRISGIGAPILPDREPWKWMLTPEAYVTQQDLAGPVGNSRLSSILAHDLKLDDERKP